MEQLPGWNFTAYTGPITGYVSEEDLDRNGRPAIGSGLRLEAEHNAEIIANIAPGDLLTMEPSTHPGFYLVTYESTFGLYYPDPIQLEPVPMNEVLGTVESPPESTPPPTVIPEPEPEPVMEEPTVPTKPATPQAAPALVDTSFTLRGKLETKRSSFYFFAPRYDYVLKDDEGGRIAWLKLEGAVFSRPLNSMIGKNVVIFGERREDPKGKNAYILVRSVRLAF